ncbi:MAG TPA: hypothetical protein VFP87_14475 [Chitinophagaceae bacterium]|nr:hypothetical protein [Chitinophagaceae bacterium]
MTFDDFRKTLTGQTPPEKLSVYLQSLWYDAKGDWNKSHLIIQNVEDKTAAWIHAYLHHKEGDIGNADYWYRRAGKTRPADSLDKEWETIVRALL